MAQEKSPWSGWRGGLIFAVVAVFVIGTIVVSGYVEVTPAGEFKFVVNSCRDSDGGQNYNVRGTLSGTGIAANLIDQCTSTYTLVERYCSGTSAKLAYYNCPYGCSNGACVAAPANVTPPSNVTLPTGTNVTLPRGTNITMPPTVSLSASPAAITSGQSSTLTWSSTNAASCSASGEWSGTKALSGSQAVTPANISPGLVATKTYTLACTGTGGTTSSSAIVSVSSMTVCGNGICESGENSLNCLRDCPCPQIVMPPLICSAGGNLTAVRDASGCTTGYSCVCRSGARCYNYEIAGSVTADCRWTNLQFCVSGCANQTGTCW
jgi:hypothetical protein